MKKGKRRRWGNHVRRARSRLAEETAGALEVSTEEKRGGWVLRRWSESRARFLFWSGSDWVMGPGAAQVFQTKVEAELVRSARALPDAEPALRATPFAVTDTRR